VLGIGANIWSIWGWWTPTGGTGFYLESLYSVKVPRTVMVFLFLRGVMGLVPCLSKWMVLPDFSVDIKDDEFPRKITMTYMIDRA